VLHIPTGRTIDVVLVDRLTDPGLTAESPDGDFILFIASDDRFPGVSHVEARSLIDRGAKYICAWGPYSDDLEESFDYAGFLTECGPELSFTLMTTSHKHDSLDDALYFALYTAGPPDDLDSPLDHVVVAAATEELRSSCLEWVAQENAQKWLIFVQRRLTTACSDPRDR
jgi:hypothetical protein